MRTLRLSKTFAAQLDELLEQGYPRFGARVIIQKRDRVFEFIENFLTRHPKQPRNHQLKLCIAPVSGTPFKVIYDFDDAEVRIHFIVHHSEPVRRIFMRFHGPRSSRSARSSPPAVA